MVGLTKPGFVRNTAMVGVLGACMVLSACAGGSRSDYVSYDTTGFGRPDAPSMNRLTSEYRIAPLDKLSINVFQVDELSGEYQVDLTGNIAMPLVGSVSAVDMTTIEFEERLTAALSEQYLRDPDVTVGVMEAAGSSVTVEGSVNEPGIYPTFGEISLIQAIALGGGLDQNANPGTVIVFRQIDGQRMAAGFDLTAIRRGQEPDPAIYRGDIIVVDGSRTRQTWRDILQTVPIFSVFRPF